MEVEEINEPTAGEAAGGQALDRKRDLTRHHCGRTSEFEFARMMQRYSRSIIRGPRSNVLMPPSDPQCNHCARRLAEALGSVWQMIECDGLLCSALLNCFRYASHVGCLSDEQSSMRTKALVCPKCLPFASHAAQPVDEKASWQLDADELESRKRANLHPKSYLLGEGALGERSKTLAEMEAIRQRRVAFPMLTANNKVVISTNAERFQLACAEAGCDPTFKHNGVTYKVPFVHLMRLLGWIIKSNYDMLPPKCKPVHANARQIPDGTTCAQGNQEAELLEEEDAADADGPGTLLTNLASLPKHAADPRQHKLKRRVFPQPHIMTGIDSITWQRRKHAPVEQQSSSQPSGISAAKVEAAQAKTESLRGHYVAVTRSMRSLSLLSGAMLFGISPASYEEMHSHLIDGIRYQPVDWEKITSSSGVVIQSVDALASVYVSPQPAVGMTPDAALIPTAEAQLLLDLAVKAWVKALAGVTGPLKLSSVPPHLRMPREGKDGELISAGEGSGGGSSSSSNSSSSDSNSSNRQSSSPSAPSAAPDPAGKKKIDALMEKGQQGLAKKAKGKEKADGPRQASTETASKEMLVAYLQLLVAPTEESKELPEWRKDARKALDATGPNSKLEFDSHLGGGVITFLQV